MDTFSEYQRAAARTGGSDLKPENRDKGLNCAAMGLAGEAGATTVDAEATRLMVADHAAELALGTATEVSR